MGIVYRARQIDSDCIVALKMIRSGIHADPQELARFRIESEAIASLFIPMSSKSTTGASGTACPYLSMEFAENGSLGQQLEKGPLSPEEAKRAAGETGRRQRSSSTIAESFIGTSSLPTYSSLETERPNWRISASPSSWTKISSALRKRKAVLGTASYSGGAGIREYPRPGAGR